MKSLTALLVSFLVCGSAWAQTKQELGRDLVALRDGKYVFEDHTLCRIDFQRLLTAMAIAKGQPIPAQLSALPNLTFQMRLQAEAGAGGFISRDYFAALVGAMSTMMQVQQAEVFFKHPDIKMEQALEALVCKTLAEPIGKPEVEVSLYLTPDGMQIESLNRLTRQKQRRTVEWEQ